MVSIICLQGNKCLLFTTRNVVFKGTVCNSGEKLMFELNLTHAQEAVC